MIAEFNGVCFCPFHDCIPLCPIQTEITDAVLHEVIVSPLRNGIGDLHFLQMLQREGEIVVSAGKFLAFADGCPEPACYLGGGESSGVEGDKMGSGHVKSAVHPGIYLENDLLIFGQPNPEIVIHAGHDAENPFQLAAHIDPVAGLQIEPVVVIGERPSGLRKTNLHHRLPGRGADRFCLPRCRSFLSLFGRSTKTTDRKTHSFSSIHNLFWVSERIIQCDVSNKPD